MIHSLMLPNPPLIPTLFITGTDTNVGKTVITAAIAMLLRRQGLRVAVSKPIATGCRHTREGLVSEDAEFLAHAADSRHSLSLINPQRYAEPLAPSVAAQRAGQPLDWPAIARSLKELSSGADVLLIEGVGGIMVPLDDTHTCLDLAVSLKAPALIVARPDLGTINHTLLTAHALRSRGGPLAGFIINRYPPDSADTAQETSPRVIERWAKLPLLAIVPDEPFMPPDIPPAILDALSPIDWPAIANRK